MLVFVVCIRLRNQMSDVPVWFDQAINTPSQTGFVTVEGANIVYETWGEINFQRD